MNFLAERITFLFDPLHHIWEQEKIHKKISIALVLLFIVTVILIECKRRNLLPQDLELLLPDNHFYAVHYAFTVVLILEVISLVFTLPCSFSRSVGMQFEILSLILLRNAFKELSQIPEPVTFEGSKSAICYILSDGFGALLIFALLGFYYYLLAKNRIRDDAMHATDLFNFVAAKKGIALVLLAMFIFMGIKSFHLTIQGIEHNDFLHDFYTLLILTDILVVLIAQCFNPSFSTIFRNSGYALSTLLIRLALAAPPYFNVLLGAAAAIFAILLVTISRRPFFFRPTPYINEKT